jgi:hypothetical protein
VSEVGVRPRTVPGEVVGWVDDPAPRIGQHPHPLAREAYDRSLLMETVADLATWLPSVRWLAVAAVGGTFVAFSAPTWVWWMALPAGWACAVDFRLPRDTWARACRLGLSTEPRVAREH